MSVGLAPLKTLRSALAALRDGRVARLEGRFPLEVQPLVDDFNGVLDRHDELVSRARTHAGNLAHALKTPLAAMSQSAAMAAGAVSRASPAAQGPDEPAQAQRALTALPSVVRDQVARAQRQVDWHLARARARAAAAHGVPGIRAEVGPTLAGLSRVMARVHAGRGLVLDVEPVEPALAFAGESQDLQEMAGNVIDNACKWARHRVRVSSQSVTGATRPRLRIVVDDDGPGIDAESRTRALQRGVRLDETVPGSGLGLAIVHELATLYEGRLGLEDAPGGGLRVVLELPAASASVVHRASQNPYATP
ncbi:MAG: Sensor protein PhoQ [Pseudomonadota bacterium]